MLQLTRVHKALDMEIRFCSVCNESIPDGEFEAGRAIVSGKSSQHVACALRRSMERSGLRSWLTFILAIYAAAVGTFLVITITARDQEPKKPETVSAVVADHINDQLLASEGRLLKRLEAGTDTLRSAVEELRDQQNKQDQILVKDLKGLEDRLNHQGRVLHDRLKTIETRLVKVEEDMGRLLEWKEHIQDQANQLTRELEKARQAAATAPPAEPKREAPTQKPETTDEDAVDPEHEAEVDRWIERLRDSDEDIVFSATIELARLKDLRAVPPLIDVVSKHKDFYARLGAATALGELQAVDGVPALIDALNDKDDLVRTAASEALQRITGENFNFVSGLGKNERIRIQRRWKQWWRENEDALRQRLNQPKK